MSYIDKMGIYSSVEAISEMLRRKVPFKIQMLTDMEKRINMCAEILEKYSSRVIFSESDSSTSQKHGFRATPRALFNQIAALDAQISSSIKRSKEKTEACEEFKETTKNVQCFTFQGFKYNELTELPVQLEGAQMLNSVINAQDFKPEFLKAIKALFLSEASVAVLQDSFWWYFLEVFQPSQTEQNQLFDRIAESFVTLFISVHQDIKDKFFMVYADCLAQAIYAIFYEAFPESHYLFGDKFKRELLELISLWVLGTMPVASSFKKWNLKWLKLVMNSPEANSDEYQLAFNLEELIENAKKTYASDTVDGAVKRDPTPAFDVNAEVQSRKPRESHYIGHGPSFHRVFFKLGGRSPLVAHFLRMHEIECIGIGHQGRIMKRTEICKLPYPFDLKINFFFQNTLLIDFCSYNLQFVCNKYSLRR
uniref:Family with sequence similarity 227 member B n=1 Tax=Latimeria chalumnae TaxID=7897 RepID=M3XHD1_LATCH